MAYATTPPASLRSGAGRQPQLEAKRGLAIVVLGDAHGEPLIRERLVSEGHEGYDDLADRLGAPEEVLCARARARATREGPRRDQSTADAIRGARRRRRRARSPLSETTQHSSHTHGSATPSSQPHSHTGSRWRVPLRAAGVLCGGAPTGAESSSSERSSTATVASGETSRALTTAWHLIATGTVEERLREAADADRALDHFAVGEILGS